MSRVKTDDWSASSSTKAVSVISQKLEAVSSKLNAYYAGHGESVSTEEASTLRGELKAYRISLEAITKPDKQLESVAKAFPCHEPETAPTVLAQIGREALGPIVSNYEPFKAKSD